MIILLEGPDLSGKTTLSSALVDLFKNTSLDSKTYDVFTHKRGPLHPERDPLDEYLVPLAEIARETEINPYRVDIMDRWHLGELVYGNLLRNASRLTMAETRYIDVVMSRIGTVFLHVTATPWTLQRRYKQRGDDMVSYHILLEVWQKYHQLQMFDFTHYQNIHTDLEAPDNGTGIDNSNYVYQRARSMHESTRAIRSVLPTEYIGVTNPEVLFVGDRRGSNAPQSMTDETRFLFDIPWPFGPWNGTSGRWLFGALHSAKVNTRECGFINANELPAELLFETWETLGCPKTIALGVNARDGLKKAHIPVAAKIPHPSYMRRFHYNDQDAYGQRIATVINNVVKTKEHV